MVGSVRVVFAIYLATGAYSGGGSEHRKIQEAFQQHHLVTDFIDEAPVTLLKIKYADNLKVNLGNEVTPTQGFNPPVYINYPAEKGSFYTLVMTDPDAPAELREYRHWLVMNIPGTDLSRGDVISAYVGPGPGEREGFHRYLFLVFRQPGHLDVSSLSRQDNTTSPGRPNFSTKQFSQSWGMNTPAIAGNFLLSQYDPTTLIIHKQLGVP